MAHVNEPFNGIIINRRNYREHDLLVKILTDKQGPTMFFVRGGKRKRFKMASDILPFTYGKYVGNLSPDKLSYIVSAQETHTMYHIGENIDSNAYGTYLLELADRAFQDGQPIGAWYGQILKALQLINGGADPQIITNVLEVQLLGRFGVAPEWRRCVICGQQTRIMDYSEIYGGLLCSNHWEKDPHRLHLDSKTVNYLRLFATLNLAKVNTVSVPNLVKRNLRWALDKIYNDQVGLRLRSKQFIDQMGTWDQALMDNQKD